MSVERQRVRVCVVGGGGLGGGSNLRLGQQLELVCAKPAGTAGVCGLLCTQNMTARVWGGKGRAGRGKNQPATGRRMTWRGMCAEGVRAEMSIVVIRVSDMS